VDFVTVSARRRSKFKSAIFSAVITAANAKERIDYHSKQLEKACGDYYAGFETSMVGNGLLPEYVREGGGACLVFYAGRHRD
jgi:hypothetical protein